MDAIILCGGYATRLEPITLFVPKPLLPVNGKPILDHIVDGLGGLKFNRFILSTNRKFYDQFEYWASNKKNAPDGMELIAEPSMDNAEKFGAIKGLKYAIEKAGIDDDIMIIAGDNYFDFDLKKLIDQFNKNRKITVALHDIKSVEEAKRFGVVEVDGEKVVGFEEKPKEPKSSLISTGIYIFPKEMLGKFKEYVNDGNNPDAPGYFLQWLMGKEDVNAVAYEEDWYDIGTVDTYRKVFDSYLK